MAIFGRNKDEDTEDEFEEEEQSNRKFTKKFKDLKPENKKQRKEPPKPWGKKERLIILITLFATVIISAILSLYNTSGFKFSNLNLKPHKINLDSLNIFKGETIIINKK